MNQALIHDLQTALGEGAVLHARESCVPFECDGLSSHRQVPDIVVLPGNVEQVRTALRLCRAAGVPVVTRGAGTGLSGGAKPVAGGVLLVLSRLNKILEIDAARRIARLQPGVTNLAISNAARPFGLFYAPDPSSQVACTIGGNVAENSGGVHCLKYGLTFNNVLQVKLLTIDGEELTLGNEMQETCGLELLALLTGSEGMLAVVTEVMVKLVPRPERTELLLAGFADVERCAAGVAAIIGAGIVPAGLEMMDAMAIRASEAFARCGYPLDAGALLLCELDGVDADVEFQIARVSDILLGLGATHLRRAADAAERDRMWSGRKSAFPAVAKLAPDYYCMDGTIPRRELPRVLQGIEELSRRYGLAIANVFHAGDGNLHPLILFDAGKPGELENAEELGAAVLELCVAAGGTVTGEHGVGVEKLGPMCTQFNSDELGAFRALKAAFDPEGLLNPGKAVPTLARCADYGALHVHQGRLPHPDLPRF
jgi:glycolate oxidase